MEYYLAKPISRIDLFWAKIINVFTLCLIIMIIVTSGNLIQKGSLSAKFQIRGYENVENITKIKSFNAIYRDQDDKKWIQERGAEIKKLLEEGFYDKAKEVEHLYSKTFIADNGLLYALFLKFYLLTWCAVLAIFYINYGDAKSPGDYNKLFLKNPIGYLKLSGWVFMFAIMLIPFLYDDMLQTSSNHLVFYLLNIKLIIPCSLLLLFGLIFALRKNYQSISI